MIFIYLLMMSLTIPILGRNCDDILCADVFDDVCGMADSKDGTQIIMAFKNICYMRKKACEMAHTLDINQVADELCNIKKTRYIEDDGYQGNGRRLNDFSIIGAHQACNHSCPTFCTDSYEPACAQIWKRNMLSYTYRPMINHCHIDLFSCAAGLNVTIQPLGKCYKNPSGLLFMQQVAALKSLKLLDDAVETGKHLPLKTKNVRRTNDEQEDSIIKQKLSDLVKKIFIKHSSDRRIQPYNEKKGQD